MTYLEIWRDKRKRSYYAGTGNARCSACSFEGLVYRVLEIFCYPPYKDNTFKLYLKGKLVDMNRPKTLLKQEKEADFNLCQQGILEKIVAMQNKIGSIADIVGGEK